MKKLAGYLFDYKNLSFEQAREAMLDIGQGEYNDAELSAFMTVFLMRSITAEELGGFRSALLEMALPLKLEGQLIDIVGTGGDGKNTFNISTISSFIVAGTGNKVAKHGNYASTSVTGASNVMEAMGYRFKTTEDELQKELNEANICFLHAPLFHPALKKVSRLRKELGIRTIFNMLGPLVNPARPAFQLLGVYNAGLARLYNYLLQKEDINFCIINSLDGYDEISLTGDTKLITPEGEQIYTPYVLGKRMVFPADLSGGQTATEAAAIFRNILKGEGTWAQNAVVLANAAVALQTTRKYGNYAECMSAAVESLESGRAYNALNTIIAL